MKEPTMVETVTDRETPLQGHRDLLRRVLAALKEERSGGTLGEHCEGLIAELEAENFLAAPSPDPEPQPAAREAEPSSLTLRTDRFSGLVFVYEGNRLVFTENPDPRFRDMADRLRDSEGRALLHASAPDLKAENERLRADRDELAGALEALLASDGSRGNYDAGGCLKAHAMVEAALRRVGRLP